MTALNKHIRNAIEESLIAATTIPAEKEALLKKAGATAREAVRKTLPKGFEDAIKTLPPEWFRTEGSASMRSEDNPRWVLQSLEDRNDWRRQDLPFEPLRVPNNYYMAGEIAYQPDKDDPKKPLWTNIMAKHVAEANKLRKKEDDLRAEIRAVLFSVNTAEKLIERVPAWEKHITPYIPTKAMPLVVSTAKAESLLKKAGFDQTEKEAA
jgi:hypothetical protein